MSTQAMGIRKDVNFALLRGLEFLKTLEAMGGGPHTIHQIRAATGTSKSAAHRMLNAGMMTGYVEQPIYGAYRRSDLPLDPEPAAALPLAITPPPLSNTAFAELTSLQLRTSQIVVLHAPLLYDTPLRRCDAIEVGARHDFLAALDDDPEAANSLREAPLHSDPAGLAILAYLDDGQPLGSQLREIRAQGYTVGGSPVPGFEMCSVPVMRGSRAVGSVSLIARTAQMERHQTRYIETTQDAAATLSSACTRGRLRAAQPRGLAAHAS